MYFCVFGKTVLLNQIASDNSVTIPNEFLHYLSAIDLYQTYGESIRYIPNSMSVVRNPSTAEPLFNGQLMCTKRQVAVQKNTKYCIFQNLGVINYLSLKRMVVHQTGLIFDSNSLPP